MTPEANWEGISWVKIKASDWNLTTSTGQIRIWVNEESTETSLETTNNNASDNSSLETITIDPITILNASKTSELDLGLTGSFTLFVNAEDSNGQKLTYTWYLNNETLEGSQNTRKFSGLEPGSHEIKVEISNGVDKISKTWNVNLGGKSTAIRTGIIIAAISAFVIGILVSAFLVIKDSKKNALIKKQAAISKQQTTPQFQQTVPRPPTNAQTNPTQVPTQPQTQNNASNPVQDYMNRINSDD